MRKAGKIAFVGAAPLLGVHGNAARARALKVGQPLLGDFGVGQVGFVQYI